MHPGGSQHPPIPENEPKPVYGYLLAEAPDELEIVAWQREIRHFCRTRGFVPRVPQMM